MSVAAVHAIDARRRLRIRVRGRVQGVGFRPYIHELAHRFGLGGWVNNDGDGVLIEVEGAAVISFLAALRRQPPPLARIDAVEVCEAKLAGETGFIITESAAGGAVTTPITPDAAVCEACLRELFDPADRRHLYPFLNCTHCGPRYTITRRLPYDRAQTSMAAFALCADCRREYWDPGDRRFHAQPLACPACGPRLDMPLAEIGRRLAAMEILAVKGLGGFHLVCDARADTAVERLRRLKDRDAKPFAVMALNPASADALAEIGAVEAALLTGRDRPIVLAGRQPGAGALAAAISPGLADLGIMLPYTPLHYLMFFEMLGRPVGTEWLHRRCDVVLVMTSANPPGEPLAIDAATIEARLGDVVDGIVDHDREIVIRADDGLMRIIDGAPLVLRRGRGQTPDAIALLRAIPPVLAVGGHLKNTVCLTRGSEAFLSQHLGDMDNRSTLDFFEQTIAHLTNVLQIEPVAVAHDKHPDFLSTRFAQRLKLPSIAVQHHHAHVAAVAAEHGLEDPVIGLALDGHGYGDAGAAWGGELLRLEGASFSRLGHFEPLPQPGGDRAAREPWRMAAAALFALGRGEEIVRRFSKQTHAAALTRLLAKGVNSPPTSSCGRLFDAACGLLGIRETVGYEAEAPMLLESLVRTPRVVSGGWEIENGRLDLLPLLGALTDMDPVAGAEAFHGTLIAGLVAWGRDACVAENRRHIVLSGGCIGNRVLTEGLIRGFAEQGITAVIPRAAPANDGGLSLGQAWIAGLGLENAAANLEG